MTRYIKSSVTVIGSGSWATAIVKMLSPNCEKICWFVHERGMINHIRKHHHNPKFLSSVSFDISRLFLTDNINRAVASSEVIILVTPQNSQKDTRCISIPNG
jgi:glycerol-3-phosphate dehydrogenase (NAD(P)+)